MNVRGYDLTYSRVLVVALLLVTLLAGGYAASTSSAAFGSYNPNWDGSRDVRLLADETAETTTIIRETARYPTATANGTTALVLSPETAYTPAEIDRLRQFVAAGGRLIVADDVGQHANQLLAGVGATTRIDGRLIRDERYYYRAPALPIAQTVRAPLNDSVTQLTLNYASVLNVTDAASVLVSTSGYAYLDTNRNGSLDASESLGTYPVAAAESVGNGRVVVVSDPSVFINSMLAQPDNRAFARAVLSSERVLFDYSHTADIPLLVGAVLTLRESAGLQLGIGVLVLLGGVLAMRRHDLAGVWSASSAQAVSLSTAEIEAVIADAHPSWPRERVERVARSIRESKEPTRDD